MNTLRSKHVTHQSVQNNFRANQHFYFIYHRFTLFQLNGGHQSIKTKAVTGRAGKFHQNKVHPKLRMEQPRQDYTIVSASSTHSRRKVGPIADDKAYM